MTMTNDQNVQTALSVTKGLGLCEAWTRQDWISYVSSHLLRVAGRNGSTNGSTAEADATRAQISTIMDRTATLQQSRSERPIGQSSSGSSEGKWISTETRHTPSAWASEFLPRQVVGIEEDAKRRAQIDAWEQFTTIPYWA
jgi:hypothetical protein